MKFENGTINLIDLAKELNLGFLIDFDPYVVFFGKTTAQLDSLAKEFQDLRLAKIHQIHSDICLSIDAETCIDSLANFRGDALYTEEANIGLCISTADCMPVMIFDPTTNRIAGIHSGWKGVVENITEKVIVKFIQKGSQIQNLRVLIGPHIGPSHFEVDKDVSDLVLGTTPFQTSFVDNEFAYFNPLNNKFYLNLYSILCSRLVMNLKLIPEQISGLVLNTFDDSRFHSFRRDRDKSGRQVSFVARKYSPSRYDIIN